MSETVYEEYIPNLVDSMLSNLKVSDNNFLLIKHYNTFDLSAEYIESLAKARPNTIFLYHSFDARRMISAYEPILGWIKQLYQQSNISSMDEFFKACDVYLLHRPVFQTYFSTGICKREEEPLLTEIQFEQKRFIDEMIRMLRYLSDDKPMVLVFNKLHAAGTSTISLIESLLSDDTNQNIAILATYNEVAPELEYVQPEWQKLLKRFVDRNCILDWTITSDSMNPEDVNAVFQFNNEDISEYCVKLINMYHTMALSQADYYLDILYHKLEVEKVYILPEYRFALMEMYGQIALFQHKPSDALLYCNALSAILETHDNPSWVYRCHYLEAQIHMYGYQQELANHHIEKCKKACMELKDPFLDFKLEMLAYMNVFNGWLNIWGLRPEGFDNEALTQKCLHFHYLNHLAHIYVYSFDNDPENYQNLATLEETLPHFYQGIQIATELGNDCFLTEAYTKNVMIASTNGYYDVANFFHQKSFEIVERNHNYAEEGGIYNGLGYNCCTMEKYTKANEYFNQALLLFAELNDMESMNETIYNMATNAILAEEYATADTYLTTCLTITRAIKANSVRVCNVSKIYGLRAYCNYKTGVYYNCKLNMQYVEQFLGHIIELEDRDICPTHLWDDDLFLYYFVGGMLSDHEGHPDEALLKLRKARKYVDRSVGSKFFNLPPYAIGYSRVAKSMGYTEEADEILRICYDFCEKKGYVYKKNMVKAEMDGKEYTSIPRNLSIKDITLEEITAKALQAGMLKDYETQKDAINFLGIWQKMINNPDIPIDKITDHAIVTFKNNYNIDEFIFIRMENGKPVLKYSDAAYEITDQKVNYLVEYFNTNRNSFVTTRLDKRYLEHKALIQEIFGFNSINTMICTPIFTNEELNSIFISCVEINMDWNYKAKRYEFDQNDISIFMMLFRQLLDAIDRMEAQTKIEHINKELQFVNSRLKQLAIKDPLTGLYNRQGFNEELELEMHKALEEKRMVKLALLYADLDNFKYYNDTFGHDIGDLILREFSTLITRICANRGYAVRYGGDEFILVLYLDDREQVEQAAKDIYANLQKQQGFVQKIAYTLKVPIEVPQEKYVSCSIGISMDTLEPAKALKEQLERTLKHADEMMYHVKKTTKHRYVFYEPTDK